LQIGGGSRIVLQVKVLENNEGPSANGQANEGTQSQPSQPSTKLIQVIYSFKFPLHLNFIFELNCVYLDKINK